MNIGLDLDNTIIDYSEFGFHAKEMAHYQKIQPFINKN